MNDMTREVSMLGRLIPIIALTVAFIGCTAKSNAPADTGMAAQGVTTPPADRAAEEAAIKQADDQFFADVNAKNAAAAAEAYSDDAIYMEAGSPALTGKDAIRKHLDEFVKLAQLAISGGATDIKFSDDGSVAYETGKFSVRYADAKGKAVKDDGKYLILWRKSDGKWKVVAESNSMDKAPGQ
jgi:uncharacterized protein (TIGR02246 family)